MEEGVDEDSGDLRHREPGQSTWMLKVDAGGHQILHILLLLSNYCSHLTDDEIGLSWLRGGLSPPPQL